MSSYNERELFSGLAADHWSSISETDPREDQDYYRTILQRQGGKALELGCGAGRLLLTYLSEGFDVVGSDISGDILAVCRRNGEAAGLKPELFEQPMQDLDLPYRFNTIYIPCGSFVCVMDRQQALETLRRCKAHLAPGGILTFNVFPSDHDYGQLEPESYPKEWFFKAEKDLHDGRSLKIWARETGLDPIEQTWFEERRYELYEDGVLTKTEVRAGQGRWYFRNEVLWMLQLAGFTEVAVTGDFRNEPFGPQHGRTMVFQATN